MLLVVLVTVSLVAVAPPAEAGILPTQFGCWVSVVGLGASVLSGVALLVYPPASPVLRWVSWGVVFVGGGTGYYGVVDNCTGVLAVSGKVMAASGEWRTVNCTRIAYANYRYDPKLRKSVPTGATWNCTTGAIMLSQDV